MLSTTKNIQLCIVIKLCTELAHCCKRIKQHVHLSLGHCSLHYWFWRFPMHSPHAARHSWVFLRIAVQIVTTPQSTSSTERNSVPMNRNPLDLALESVAVKDLPVWLLPEAVNFPTPKDIELLKEEEKAASTKIQNALRGVLRWITVIVIFAIAYGGSLAVVQIAGNNFSPAAKVVLPVLISLVIAVIGLAIVMVSIKGSFTSLQAAGWLGGLFASILFGSGIGIYTWMGDNQCVDPVCVYNNQIIGLTAGLGLLFAVLYFTEWWNVWGEKYRTGNWTVGIIVGFILAILLAWIGAGRLAIFGWIASTFIILRGATGDHFYGRRLFGFGPEVMLVGFIPLLGSLIATPNCLCAADLSVMTWRWLGCRGDHWRNQWAGLALFVADISV